MKVSVACNGVDNIIEKLSYKMEKDSDLSDSDVIYIISFKEDKAVKAFLQKIKDDGVTAYPIIKFYAKEGEKNEDIADGSIISDERNLLLALEDMMNVIDYYSYITFMDIGDALSDFGRFDYKNLGSFEGLKDVSRAVCDSVKGRSKAILYLNIGEDIWESEVNAFLEELSLESKDVSITVSALRGKEGCNIRASIFSK